MHYEAYSASTLYRQLKKHGYVLHKSRWRKGTRDNFGGYQIVNDRNWCVGGWRYQLTLEDVSKFYDSILDGTVGQQRLLGDTAN